MTATVGQTMMRCEIMKNCDGTIEFHGHIDFNRAVTLLELSLFDMALMREVDKDKAATISDYLLVLEMLFRRHEEFLEKEAHAGAAR